MANTLKFGNGQWATGNGTALAYNDENANFKPLPFGFTRASSGTTVNQSGLIETVGNGIPRIDFLGNTKGALLLEPSRSNAITYSEDFSQSVWNKTGLTVSSNQIISPDGSLNADEINITGVNAHYLFDVISVNASTNYVLTFYAKKGTATDVSYSIYDNSNGADIIASTSYYSQISNTNWNRITVEFTTPSGCTSVRPYPLRDGSSAGTVYIWGAQLEAGSYPTSYIRTSGSAVTRVQDDSSQIVPNGVSLSTTGTVFLDYTLNIDLVSAAHFPFSITDYNNNSSNEWLTRGSFRFTINTNGSVTYEFVLLSAAISTTTTVSDIFTSIGSRGKMAVSWDGTNVTFSVNGVNYQDTLSTNFTGSLDGIYLGVLGTFNNTHKGGQFNDIKLYNTRLSNAELQALTT